MVPGTFLVADVAGQIVGRASIRHKLNDFLARQGGHIGYAVLPGHRRRGYATEILRQSLVIARAVGVDRVLMICDEDNAGSRAVIEACGGETRRHRHNRFATHPDLPVLDRLSRAGDHGVPPDRPRSCARV